MILKVDSDYLKTIGEGNYKLVGRLLVNQVPVAEDFFIFNLNHNTVLDYIQESNRAVEGYVDEEPDDPGDDEPEPEPEPLGD